MDVGSRLKQLREAKELNTNKLANMAGLSQSFVREIERNTKKPTIESLEYLCDALGITIKDFFDDGIIDTIQNDNVFRTIYTLSKHQRQTLLEFIDAMRRE